MLDEMSPSVKQVIVDLKQVNAENKYTFSEVMQILVLAYSYDEILEENYEFLQAEEGEKSDST